MERKTKYPNVRTIKIQRYDPASLIDRADSPYAANPEQPARMAKDNMERPQYLLRSSAERLERLLIRAKNKRKAAALIQGKRLLISRIPKVLISFATSVTLIPNAKTTNAWTKGL